MVKPPLLFGDVDVMLIQETFIPNPCKPCSHTVDGRNPAPVDR